MICTYLIIFSYTNCLYTTEYVIDRISDIYTQLYIIILTMSDQSLLFHIADTYIGTLINIYEFNVGFHVETIT